MIDKTGILSRIGLMKNKLEIYIFSAWIVATAATVGSLFFSEVMEYIPCKLCWYQRIGMYPLVLILGVSFIKTIKDIFWIVMPLSVAGQFISVYHLLLQWEVIPETLSPCVEGVPCSVSYIFWGGFITIPLLSFVAFLLINILIILYQRTLYEK